MEKIKITEKVRVYRIAYSNFDHFISPKDFFDKLPPTIDLEYGEIYDLIQKLDVEDGYAILKLKIDGQIYWSSARFELVDTKQDKVISQNEIVSIKAQKKTENKKQGKVTFVVG